MCSSDGVFLLMQALQEHNIRCSVIGLSAEIRVFKKLCQTTNGESSRD